VTNPYPCAPPNQQVGSVLYKGTYNPQLHEMPGRPYQNFTVTVPDVDYFVGRAQLSVSRFHLIGVRDPKAPSANGRAHHSRLGGSESCT
jgi:hypothetical protein